MMLTIVSIHSARIRGKLIEALCVHFEILALRVLQCACFFAIYRDKERWKLFFALQKCDNERMKKNFTVRRPMTQKYKSKSLSTANRN